MWECGVNVTLISILECFNPRGIKSCATVAQCWFKEIPYKQSRPQCYWSTYFAPFVAQQSRIAITLIGYPCTGTSRA